MKHKLPGIDRVMTLALSAIIVVPSLASGANASTITVGETGTTATIKTDVPLPSDWGAFMSGKVTAQCDENDGGFDCAAEKDTVSAVASNLQLLISFDYAVDGQDSATDNDHDFGTTTFSGSISYSPISGGKAESVSFGNVNVIVTDAIPEPSTLAMVLLGFAGLSFAGYRGRKRAAALG